MPSSKVPKRSTPLRRPRRTAPAGLRAELAGRREVVAVPREAAGARLDRFLATALALPVERARALVEAGRARIRGKACSPSRKLFGGEEVAVERRAPRPVEASGPELAVLHDDADCLVIAKPAGLAVEPSGPNSPSVISAASRLGAFDLDGSAAPGLPHRLDRDTSGALLLARHDRALMALRARFEAGEVLKEYLAIVAGSPPAEGRLDTPYARSPVDPRRFTTRSPSARRARLSWKVERALRGAALLRIRLETGRTHQIRVQLSEAGYPVLGDATYGVGSEAIARQALHAERLAFPPPSGGPRVDVRAPLPEDLARAIESLGG